MNLKPIIGVGVCLAFWACGQEPAALETGESGLDTALSTDQCYTFETERIFGQDSQWIGINDKGVLAGSFCIDEACSRLDGVVHDPRRGTYETFPPIDGFARALVQNINNRGEVAGTFQNFATGEFFGFVRSRDGEINVLEPVQEGGPIPAANDINARGKVSGSFFDIVAGIPQGFVLGRKGYEVISLGDEGVNSVLLNDHGDLVINGFVSTYIQLRGEDPVAFQAPPNPVTFAVGINNRRTVVGRTFGGTDPSNFVFDNFIRRRDGTFQILDIPGAGLSTAAAINNRGVIVGGFLLPGGPFTQVGTSHAFIAMPCGDDHDDDDDDD